jgi:hypothetical protein
MKLYEFTTTKYGDPKLGCEEFIVEEKSKTYVTKYRRFHKDDIGKVSGYSENTVLLLENNSSIAAQLFIEQKRNEYDELQEKLKRKDDEIKMLIKYIKQ